jgi:putative ABC transport system permease protein
MRRFLREFRRAPARIIATVVALSLALGAIGVMGVPEVSRSSLREGATADAIANIAIDTTDTGPTAIVDIVESVPGVDAAESRVTARVDTGDEMLLVLGADLGRQQIDIVHADAGRLPTGRDEVLVVDGMADIGSTIPVTAADGTSATLRVVGVGGTSYWAGEDLAFASIETARELGGVDGSNRLVVHAPGDADDLRHTADAVRDALAAERVAVTALPVTVPHGQHPIEADIEQISMLVGLLGIVAGLVALVLLGSTTTTLITERAREVAVMRALGGRKRAIRRRLRGLALSIAVVAVAIGVPLGVLVSNYIARMVLEEFVGLTPGFAFSVPVMIGSALFALVGARLVAARAARRVTNRDLATALRDRQATPFGQRISDRIAVRVRLGGLLERWGLRNGLHQRARSVTMLAQVTAAVAALLVITSMATTITAFNVAEYAHRRHDSATSVPGPGLDMSASLADGDGRSEMAIEVEGEYEDWTVDVVGLAAGSQFIDPVLDAGEWYGPAPATGEVGERQVVLSTGFAERVGVAIGDTIELRLANGNLDYEVVGLHPARGRYAFTEVDRLGEDLGAPGRANVLLSLDSEPSVTPPGPISIERLGDVTGDEAARDAVLLIFAASGGVIVSVAGLAVASGLAVSVYERRHELAALQAIGGRRRHIMRVVVAELAPIVIVGVVLGIVLGYLGALGLVSAFEAADAVEIGLVFSTGVVPIAAVVAVVGALGLGSLMARRVTRRPAAVTLGGAG